MNVLVLIPPSVCDIVIKITVNTMNTGKFMQKRTANVTNNVYTCTMGVDIVSRFVLEF